jgi:hypothetical protein
MEWTGARRNSGHGLITINNRTMSTHRVAYELEHGPIPRGMCVLHRCDNPPCCNVAHLFVGTKTDNNVDRDSKLRFSSRLSAEQVQDIRSRITTVRGSQAALAREFGVSRATISMIATGVTWRMILDGPQDDV